MSTVAHIGRPKEERKSKAVYNGKVAHYKKYQEIEDLISRLTCEIVNGVPRSDIITKLKEGLYEEQPQPYKESTAVNYYWTAMQRLREDREDNLETLKDKLYSQYYQLYQDAMLAGNTIGAKSVLDSIAKLFLDTEKKNTNIQVNANKEGIKISFGFANDEKDEE